MAAHTQRKTNAIPAAAYLAPEVPRELPWHPVPLVRATPESLKGYGKPDKFIAFYVDGGKGLYIHPNVWHEAVFPLAERASFYDEQGKVHARVSCNLATEFGVFLSVPLAAPA